MFVDFRFSVSSDKPRLIFTGGAMGAGKSFALKRISPQINVKLNEFVRVDPDQIKEELPEFELLKKENPDVAGSQVHLESGFIQELIVESALMMKK